KVVLLHHAAHRDNDALVVEGVIHNSIRPLGHKSYVHHFHLPIANMATKSNVSLCSRDSTENLVCVEDVLRVMNDSRPPLAVISPVNIANGGDTKAAGNVQPIVSS